MGSGRGREVRTWTDAAEEEMREEEGKLRKKGTKEKDGERKGIGKRGFKEEAAATLVSAAERYPPPRGCHATDRSLARAPGRFLVVLVSRLESSRLPFDSRVDPRDDGEVRRGCYFCRYQRRKVWRDCRRQYAQDACCVL